MRFLRTEPTPIVPEQVDELVGQYISGVGQMPRNLEGAQRLMHAGISDLVQSGVSVRTLDCLSGYYHPLDNQRDILTRAANTIGVRMQEAHSELGVDLRYDPESPNKVGAIMDVKVSAVGSEIGNDGLIEHFQSVLKESLKFYKFGAGTLRKQIEGKPHHRVVQDHIDEYVSDPTFLQLLSVAIDTSISFHNWQEETGIFEKHREKTLKTRKPSRENPAVTAYKLFNYCMENPTDQKALTRWQVFKTAFALG